MSERRPARRAVPMRQQRDIALRQLGELMRLLGMVQVEVEPIDFQLDHNPALALRPVNEAGDDYDPPQHDARYLVWLPKNTHRLKTTGRTGESKLSISGNGDVSRIRKAERLEKSCREFRDRLLAKTPRAPDEPKPRSKSPLRSRSNLRRAKS